VVSSAKEGNVSTIKLENSAVKIPCLVMPTLKKNQNSTQHHNLNILNSEEKINDFVHKLTNRELPYKNFLPNASRTSSQSPTNF